ncbi:MAG: hypothetical protein IJY73_05325 [Oscillospiraceae bacterium]|nr:hypothetical protein [Oscillospiraceae bacterium]
MTTDEKKSFAEELLRKKYKELGRLPQKEDFDDSTRSRIKAFLGPWPRALEAAGLKEAKIKPKKSHKRKRKNPSKKNCLVPHQKASKTNISEPEGYITPNEKGE